MGAYGGVWGRYGKVWGGMEREGGDMGRCALLPPDKRLDERTIGQQLPVGEQGGPVKRNTFFLARVFSFLEVGEQGGPVRAKHDQRRCDL